MKQTVGVVVLGCALIVGNVLWAEEDPAPKEAIPVPQAAAPSPLSLIGGVDYVTAYYSRGYNQEDTGLILQPYASLYAKLYSSDQLSISPFVGAWNSFHDADTLATRDPEWWYESDLWAGIDFSSHNFTLSLSQVFFLYPGGAFDTIQEFDVRLAYDDTELMKKINCPIVWHPYVLWGFETGDGNGPQNQYVEPGLVPLYAISETPVTLSVPLAVGLSPNGYYTSETGHTRALGYASVGLFISRPLPLPERMGTWTLAGGITYIRLFADSTEDANGGDDDDVVAKVGINIVY